MTKTQVGTVSIEWLGHAGFLIKGQNKVIYIDPFMISEEVRPDEEADILLITHEHSKHCDPDSIRKVRGSMTTTLIPENLSLQFKGDARRIIEGDELTGALSIKGVNIEVTPAYNLNKTDHLREEGVGYILELDGIKIYHAGDTDLIPEMENIHVDVAILPISSVGIMDENDAAKAVSIIKPKIVIPMHYELKNEDNAALLKFKDLVDNNNSCAEVRIL